MTHNYICSTPQKTVRDFESWRQVPKEFKTRDQWLRCGRKVPKQERPTARVLYPRVVQWMSSYGRDTIIINETDEIAVISETHTKLFNIDQTVPYTAQKRTLAYWEYEQLFFKLSRKDCWIRKTDPETGDELENWVTETEFPYEDTPHLRNLLSTGLIRKHINQRQIIGVKGDKRTRFVIIDLDYHGRDLHVFEQQAKALLDRFHGNGTWHFQVKRQDVTGLQLIYAFQNAKEITAVHNMLRGILAELDIQHPELAIASKNAGMKSLADLEIYPTTNNGNGVRLPLCLDREMLLDKPLALIAHQKRQVQDVEGYIRWLSDPDRKYMDKEQILDYLHYFAQLGGKSLPKGVQKPPAGRIDSITEKQWRGNLRRWLYEFWIDGNANGRPLNEHLVVLARLAAVQGYSESEIVQNMNGFIRELPASSKTCSSRLLKDQFRQIDGVIQSTAKYVCQNNGHQRDPKQSAEIFAAALVSWPEFDALDKSTWNAPVEKKTVVPNWSESQRKRLCAFFRKPLFVKDDELIIRFLSGIVNLTIAKEKEGNGWGREYLLKWVNSQFPELKFAKDQKRQRIMVCLEAEGIIQAVCRGRAGMYCTHWTLGSTAKEALGITSSSTTDISSSVIEPNTSLVTSTYYSSLFEEAENVREANVV
jgi:hypothetical protein